MENLFKKFIYTGVGFVSFANDKFQKAIEKLIEENKISTEEGKKIVEDFLKNTETKKDEMENQISSIVDKVLKTFNYGKKSEIKNLKNRISILEELLAKKNKKEEPHADDEE